MYRKSVWKSADGNVLEIKRYHAAHCMPEKEKNIKRRLPKAEGTGWKQEEINRRRRTEHIQRLLSDNFYPGDHYCTLTYRTGELPETEQQARADFSKFKRSVRDFYARQKLACPWIGIIEHLHGGGRTHMHIILPALPPDKINKLKKLWPHGNVDIRAYGGTPLDAYRLADYYTKETTEKNSSAVMTSRNLRRTEPHIKTESADTWSDKINVPAGYELVPELSYSTETEGGYPLWRVVFQKINPVYLPRPPLPPKNKKKRRNKHGSIKKNAPQNDKG